MNLWKEKVADKLSRLFADSPTSSSHIVRDSPVVRAEPQAIPFSLPELSSPSYISSYVASFLQNTSSGVDKKSDKHASWHGLRPIPLPSLPTRWKSKSFSSKDRPIPYCVDADNGSESDEAAESSNPHPENVSQGITHSSSKVEEASTSHSPEIFLSTLMDESTFITSDLFEFLQSSLPNIVKGCRWVLLYRTAH